MSSSTPASVPPVSRSSGSVATMRQHHATASPATAKDAAPKPPSHPYLMLWSGRDVSDPYEPFFVTDDDAHHSRASRSYLVGGDSEYGSSHPFSKLTEYPKQAMPTQFGRSDDCDSSSKAVTVHYPAKRARRAPVLFDDVDADDTVESQACSGAQTSEDGPSDELVADEHYIAAVKAAARYNTGLAADREQMRLFYEADAFERQRRNAQGDKQDGDSSNSD